MKKILGGVLLIVGALLLLRFRSQPVKIKEAIPLPSIVISPSNTPTPINKEVIMSKSIFVPYWTDLGSQLLLDGYDKIIYFGVEAGTDGINFNEAGYKNLEAFNSAVDSNKEKYLTVRMLNQNTNQAILANKESWTKIAKETMDIVEKYKFDGVVLDLEMGGILLSNTSTQVNDFVDNFYSVTTGSDVKLFLTMYGDVFYRKRGYDLGFLSRHSDGILVMAYDFHKSGGEPGPNFPFSKMDKYNKQKYDYDFRQMVDDFLAIVPKEKISFIFGMYGYDWSVDQNKKPLKPAKALTLNEIKKQFLGKCEWQDCLVVRDPVSKETEVDYVSSEMVNNFANMYYHIVWFEDEESVKVKVDYLKSKGIGNVGYFTYGYF